MSPRTLLVAVATLLAISDLPAQPPQVRVWPNGYTPVLTSEIVSVDPYATVGTASPWPWLAPPSWLGGTIALPRTDMLRDRLWLRTEYLRWKGEGMDVPPLVTTAASATPSPQDAALGQPGTSVLFGGGELNDESVSGIRVRGGFWVRRDATFGIETEYFGLKKQNDNFAASGDGTTILGIPYFDVLAGNEAVQRISYPDDFSGAVQIGSQTRFRSFLIDGRAALVPACYTNVDERADRIDAIFGYRHLDLDDDLVIAHQRTSLRAGSTGRNAVDQFSTRNDFNGAQFGFVYEANFRRVWLESLLRVAVGNNKQQVSIAGASSVTDAGTTTDYSGGLFAQRTNIGTYERDQFAMIPELGLTLGVRITDWLHATLGYSVVYFPNVVRAGDQVDRDLNPNLIPPETTPFAGPLRPGFAFIESDYWAHGINLGGELRF